MTTTGISMSAFGAGSNGTLGVGIDVTSTVNGLLSLQRRPEDTMKSQLDSNKQMISALQGLNSQLLSFSNSITTLGDFVSGAFSSTTANSSDTGVLTATADSSASVGKHTIAISQLATTSSTYAGPVPANATLAAGTMSFTVGGVTKNVTINSTNNTLVGLANSINKDSTLGVTATVLQGTSGATLALVSNTSGTAGKVQVVTPASVVTTVTNADGSSGTQNIAMKFFSGTDAQDASVIIDGVPVTQGSNTLDDIIPGVTINLWSDSSQAVTLNVAPDTTTTAQAIQDFVTNYNSIITSVNAQFIVDPTTNSEGLLGNDSTVKTLQSQLLSMISYQTSDKASISTLRSLGIEMQNDGTLTVNSSTLSSVLQNNFDQVKSFFQNTTNGFATTMKFTMLKLTSPSTGLLTVDIQGLTSTNQDLTHSIQDFEDRMTSLQDRLTDEYNRINATMEQFPALMQSLSAQLSSLQPIK